MWQAVAAAVAGQVVSGMMDKGEKGGGGGGQPFIPPDPYKRLASVEEMSPDPIPGPKHHVAGAPDSPGYAQAVKNMLDRRDEALAKVGGPEELAKLLSRDSEVINAYGETKFV